MKQTQAQARTRFHGRGRTYGAARTYGADWTYEAARTRGPVWRGLAGVPMVPLLILILLTVTIGTAVGQETVLRTDGELAAGDERMDEQGAIDWYPVSVDNAGRIRAHAVSVDFEPRLIIRLPDAVDSEAEGSRGSVSASTYVPAGRTVEVGVTAQSAEGSGVYSLRVRREDAPDALRIGETRRGALERSDEQLEDQRYVDWYPLRLEEQKRVFISVSSTEVDTYLLLRRGGRTVMENDDFQDSNAGLSYTSDGPEVLQIGASSYSAEQTGSYDITIEELPLPRKVEIGQTLIGTLEGDEAPLGNTDAYSLSGDEGDLAVVRLSSSDFDTLLELRLPDGTVRRNDDAPDGGTDSQLFHAFTGNAPLEVLVRSFGGDGAGKYELSILNFVSEDRVQSVSDGQLLEDGERISAVLDQDAPEEDGRRFHRYRFEAEEGRRLRVTAESGFFDTLLTVVAPDGSRFEDDDGAGGTDSLVDMQAPVGGTYELLVSTFSTSGMGPYTVEFEEGEQVSVIDQLQAELTDDTARRNDEGRLVAEHSFAGEAGQEVTIEARSDEFDTRLALEAPDGTVIAENDDFGSGTDSRIIERLPEGGTYLVYVSGYWEDSEGLYTLVISE